jgi:dipeptidyl aminopeptidase/acylaminoacyl peptidase
LLKGKGVPSRLVFFPDENHWILKPRNSQLWYREFFAWLSRWAKPGGIARSRR